MVLSSLDLGVLVVTIATALGVALYASRRSGRSAGEFFLSGRTLPWWMLGMSMVATTFSTDTPNLVTDLVRTSGVAGNWVWWAFLLTGMLTVFVYARLWHRSGVETDLEFYELRYSGRSAVFLRGFRALYLGVVFNVMIMAAVTLAAIKIGGVLFGVSPLQTVIVASLLSVAMSAFGGLRGVVLSDVLLFGLAMAGSIAAAVYAVGEAGGLEIVLATAARSGRLDLVPDLADLDVAIPLFFVPLAVQWWATWYPGSEPGGGGYVAQRMLAARDERHALGAVLFFNAAHYALRPWPWILVALASLVVYPELDDLARAFPAVDPDVLGHDLAYPAMLVFLPSGVLGMAVASLVAAYVSTVSTHLNWGGSYVVYDFYRRFLRPGASERELVGVARLTTVVLMALTAVASLALQNALQAFQILLQIGAGTGLLFILRWFWWRINAWSEIVAMAVSFSVAFFFAFGPPTGWASWVQLCVGVGVTTIAWLGTAVFGPPTEQRVLECFCRRIRPGGPGWAAVAPLDAMEGSTPWPVPRGLLSMALGSIAVYAALFATGLAVYGRMGAAATATAVAAAAGLGLWRNEREEGGVRADSGREEKP